MMLEKVKEYFVGPIKQSVSHWLHAGKVMSKLGQSSRMSTVPEWQNGMVAQKQSLYTQTMAAPAQI